MDLHGEEAEVILDFDLEWISEKMLEVSKVSPDITVTPLPDLSNQGTGGILWIGTGTISWQFDEAHMKKP